MMPRFAARSAPRVLAFAAVAATALVASTAEAGDAKRECIAASDKAQQMRIEGKLRAAREQLAICGRSDCPAIIRQDCGQWMSEIIASLPSVVFGARDAQGHDILAVRVSMDGAVVAEALEGKPIPVDPGVHKFRYETQGASPVEDQVVVREGEKNRALTVTFSDKNLPTPVTAPESGPNASNPPTRHSEVTAPTRRAPPPVIAYVLGGVGVVALGSALFFDFKANSDANDLNNTCKPNCPPSDVDAVRTKWVIAGVSLGVGVVAIGIATYLFLVRPVETEAEAKVSAFRFDFRPAPGGGVAEVGARF